MWPKFYLTNFLFSCINSGVKPTMQDLNLYYSIQFFNLCIFFHILKFFVKFLNRVIYYEAISYFDYITPVYGDPSIAFFIFQLFLFTMPSSFISLFFISSWIFYYKHFGKLQKPNGPGWHFHQDLILLLLGRWGHYLSRITLVHFQGLEWY